MFSESPCTPWFGRSPTRSVTRFLLASSRAAGTGRSPPKNVVALSFVGLVETAASAFIAVSKGVAWTLDLDADMMASGKKRTRIGGDSESLKTKHGCSGFSQGFPAFFKSCRSLRTEQLSLTYFQTPLCSEGPTLHCCPPTSTSIVRISERLRDKTREAKKYAITWRATDNGAAAYAVRHKHAQWSLKRPAKPDGKVGVVEQRVPGCRDTTRRAPNSVN